MNNQALQKARQTIAKYRIDAEEKCRVLLEKLDGIAEWHDNETQLRKLTVDVAFKRADDNELQKQIAVAKKRRAELLAKYRLCEDDLTPHYRCPVCNDLGYVNNQPCECLKSEIRKNLWNNEQTVNKNFTFDRSTEKDAHNVKVMENCRLVCEKIGNTRITTVVVTGKTGTGKTYLMNAMANHLISNEKSVVFQTAFALNNTFLQIHLADVNAKQRLWDKLFDADALFIDDLGTENVLKNVSAEYLFALINERVANGKLTVVCTNLTLEQLQARYEDRIFGRLVDVTHSLTAELVGEDKRTNK